MIRLGESGKLFGYNVNFDISASTLLELKVTNPSGVEVAIDSSRITKPSIAATFNENSADKVYNANEYMQFIIEETDFTVSGHWFIEGRYINTATTPDQIYTAERKIFTVSEGY